MSSHKKVGALLLGLTMMFAVEGCKKKVPAPPPPPKPVEQPAPAPAKPSITSFAAEPSTIERGQAATLRWAVTGETTGINISPGIGNVAATGSRQVFPSNTTTYTITANGPGGSDTGTASVSVTQPAAPPPPPPPPAPKATISQRLASDVADVYFDYDKSDVREDARSVLTRNADALKAILRDFPNEVITIEGHCDERGSAEYNLGLGDRRATGAREFLAQLGVAADRMKLVSYGKERPQCTEGNEDCWQKNRRAHFTSGGQ